MKNITARIGWILNAKDGTSASINTLVSKALILIVNLGTGALTARLLGPTGRGELLAIILWPQFFMGTFTFGMPAALLFLLKKNPKSKSTLYTKALLLTGISGVIVAIIGSFLMPIWLTQSSPEVVRATQLSMLFVPLGLLGLVAMVPMLVDGDFAASNKIAQLQASLTLLVLIGLSAIDFINPFSAAVAYLIPIVFGLIYVSLRTSKYIEFNKISRDASTFASLIKCSLKFYGVEFINTVSNQATQVIATSLLQPDVAGLYAIAFSLSRLTLILQTSTVGVLISKISALPIDNVKATVARSIKIILIPSSLLSIILIIFSKFILILLYGDEFRPAEHIFQVLVIESLLSGVISLLMQAFMAVGKPEVLTISQCSGFLINAILIVMLTPSYGALGLSVSLLIATFFRLVFILFSFPIYLKSSVPNLIPGKNEVNEIVAIIRKRRN
jgi:O-antigen/teichoic acid export membrane protein